MSVKMRNEGHTGRDGNGDLYITFSVPNREGGLERDGVAAIVEIHAPPHRLVSLLTREAVDELDLQPGDLATASVKSTNVTVEVPRP